MDIIENRVQSTTSDSVCGLMCVSARVCAHVCMQDREVQQFYCGRQSLGAPVPSRSVSGSGCGAGNLPKINMNPGSAPYCSVG